MIIHIHIYVQIPMDLPSSVLTEVCGLPGEDLCLAARGLGAGKIIHVENLLDFPLPCLIPGG